MDDMIYQYQQTNNTFFLICTEVNTCNIHLYLQIYSPLHTPRPLAPQILQSSLEKLFQRLSEGQAGIGTAKRTNMGRPGEPNVWDDVVGQNDMGWHGTDNSWLYDQMFDKGLISTWLTKLIETLILGFDIANVAGHMLG